MRRPRLALTADDPAGIGPEIVLKALSSPRRPDADWVVYGSIAALDDRARRLALPQPRSLGVALEDTGGGPFDLAAVSAAGGRSAAESVLRAARDALAGRAAGLVTGPLHKESGDRNFLFAAPRDTARGE